MLRGPPAVWGFWRLRFGTGPEYKEIVVIAVDDAMAACVKRKREMLGFFFNHKRWAAIHTTVARKWERNFKARAPSQPSRERREARARASRVGWSAPSRSTDSIGLGTS